MLRIHRDPRGSFDRLYDAQSFADAGLVTTWRQVSVAHTARRGTGARPALSAAPARRDEAGALRPGAIHDVIVDLRRSSPAYRRHVALTLTAAEALALYVPPGVAHGYQTLGDDVTVVYQITPDYHPEAATGVRFDDPALAIDLPLPVSVIGDRDRHFPDFEDAGAFDEPHDPGPDGVA